MCNGYTGRLVYCYVDARGRSVHCLIAFHVDRKERVKLAGVVVTEVVSSDGYVLKPSDTRWRRAYDRLAWDHILTDSAWTRLAYQQFCEE